MGESEEKVIHEDSAEQTRVHENGDAPKSESNGTEKSEKSDGERDVKGLDSRNIFFFVNIVVGVCQGCFFIYQSLLPYMFKKYGIDTVTLGYVMSGSALLQLFLSPVMGKFGDKFGARAVLMLSAASTACGHLLLGVASDFPSLLGARLATVTQDIRLGAQMMVTDLVAGKDRGPAMGKIMLPMSIGMFVGPALGGQLAKYLGEQNSLLLTWMAPVACILLLLTFVPKNTKQASAATADKKGADKKKSVMALIGQGQIPLLMLMKVLSGIPFMTFAQNIGVIGMTVFKLSPQMNGLILSYNGVLGLIISAFLLGKITKTFSENQLMKIAPVLLIVAYFLLSQINHFYWMFVVLIPWNLGATILDNQIVSRLTRSVPQSDTGAIIGLNAALFQLARIVAPLLGGVIIQNYGFQYIGYLAGITSILLASVAFLGFN